MPALGAIATEVATPTPSATRCGCGGTRYGAAPSSYDWSRTHARKRGGDALTRLNEGDWPPSATVIDLYGTWAAARADAFPDS